MTANLLSVGTSRSIGERNEQPAFLGLIKRGSGLDSYLKEQSVVQAAFIELLLLPMFFIKVSARIYIFNTSGC